MAKCVITFVSFKALAALLLGQQVGAETTVPKDLKVRRVYEPLEQYPPTYFCVIVESEEFDDVPEGDSLPVMQFEYRKQDESLYNPHKQVDKSDNNL